MSDSLRRAVGREQKVRIYETMKCVGGAVQRIPRI